MTTIRQHGQRPASGAPQVVVAGARFGGLAAVRRLARAGIQATLIDRNVCTTFQPLLYQVATTGLAGDRHHRGVSPRSSSVIGGSCRMMRSAVSRGYARPLEHRRTPHSCFPGARRSVPWGAGSQRSRGSAADTVRQGVRARPAARPRLAGTGTVTCEASGHRPTPAGAACAACAAVREEDDGETGDPDQPATSRCHRSAAASAASRPAVRCSASFPITSARRTARPRPPQPRSGHHAPPPLGHQPSRSPTVVHTSTERKRP